MLFDGNDYVQEGIIDNIGHFFNRLTVYDIYKNKPSKSLRYLNSSIEEYIDSIVFAKYTDTVELNCYVDNKGTISIPKDIYDRCKGSITVAYATASNCKKDFDGVYKYPSKEDLTIINTTFEEFLKERNISINVVDKGKEKNNYLKAIIILNNTIKKYPSWFRNAMTIYESSDDKYIAYKTMVAHIDDGSNKEFYPTLKKFCAECSKQTSKFGCSIKISYYDYELQLVNSVQESFDTAIEYQLSRLDQYQEEFALFESMCRADIREMNMIHEDASEEEKKKNKESTWEIIKNKIIHLIQTIIHSITSSIESIAKSFHRSKSSEGVYCYIMNKEKFMPILAKSNIEFSKDFAVPNINNVLNAIESFNNKNINLKENYSSNEEAYGKIMGFFLNDKDISKNNLKTYLEDLFLIRSNKKHMDGKYIKDALELFQRRPLGVLIAEAGVNKLKVLEGMTKNSSAENQRNITAAISVIKDFQQVSEEIFSKATNELDMAVNEIYRKIKDSEDKNNE